MRSIRHITLVSTAGVLGLCLLGSCLQPRSAVQHIPLSTAPPPHSAAQAALRRAAQFRTRAKLAASESRSELEEWDAPASAGIDAEEWRLQQLAMDRSGDLRQAQHWAEEAARLAQTAEDRYQVAELQVLLDHERGRHDVELQDARRLMSLAPVSERARMVLRRAEQCFRARGAGAVGRPRRKRSTGQR